ncbi:hypothetical protein [Methylomicrobium sp. Wu6]|uniref:hypothetical protein n=1 Tax=Methylomicrobium sp. Wu6 TaxID=3107928 RepID=UPI002DD69DB1|nr:hypothetical protein [Methylomicrobium sp. Wu6]MEC4748122.1 hypothetical protein [Methylomicrobium sp. Wu6]
MKYKMLVLASAIAAVSLPALHNAAQAETPPPVAAPAEALPPEVTGPDKELDLFRSSLRMEKWKFVREAMGLNGDEEKKFLSQYNKYEADLKKLNDKRVAIIKDYAASFENMNDKKADELVKRSFEFRKQRNALLEKYYGKVAKATSKVIGARFLQVESVLQGAGDVAIGSDIPLMSK